ncbi:hypothetical protein MVES_002470 [Malassezia vespertilionis]|uniref:Uncharacterized protein n=1 Tax=Malassezia vespertilionis TaxID=2020962 RepID=A0A2N1JAJ5_9BASI|nr:hypothetical protein MVES_002470 [Malassezia vespertilionis]
MAHSLEDYHRVQNEFLTYLPLTPVVPLSMMPHIAIGCLGIAFLLTFYYTTLPRTKMTVMEPLVALAASALAGVGVVALFNAVGVYAEMVHLDLAPPAPPTTYEELARELDSIPRYPVYPGVLSADAMRQAQARCAMVKKRQTDMAARMCPNDHSDIDAAWERRRSNLHTRNVSPGALDTSVPPAFHFDTYDQLPLYAQAVPIQDQNALENVPIATYPIPNNDVREMVVQISVYSRRHVALTRKTRGLSSVMPDTLGQPLTDDIDDGLVLSQKIECSTDQTLEALANAIVCRNREIPERVGWEGDVEAIKQGDAPIQIQGHWTGAHEISSIGATIQYPLYTGAMLQTDTCMLLDGFLYGKLDPALHGSYVRALLDKQDAGVHLFPYPVVYGNTLSNVRIRDLPHIVFGQPHWMLHMGDCEHIFTMDWVRRMQPKEPIFSYTTYLQRWAQTPLARQYFSPKKLVVRNEKGALPCEICGGMREAAVAVLGGDAVQIVHGERTRLDGTAQML